MTKEIKKVTSEREITYEELKGAAQPIDYLVENTSI